MHITLNEAALKNLNHRQQKNGDDNVTAVDLNCSAVMSLAQLALIAQGSDLLSDLIGQSEMEAAYRDFFWDGQGRPRELGLGDNLAITRKFDNATVRLWVFTVATSANDNECIFQEMAIGKFKFTPKLDHRAEVSFQIQGECDRDQWSWLHPIMEKGAANVELSGLGLADSSDDDDDENGQAASA